ncbi:MAG: transcription initiation factor IIB family protein [Halobacteriales archaeon]
MYSNETTISVRELRRDGEEPSRQTETDGCPECGGMIISDGGERRCGECGLVTEETQLDRRGRPSYPSDHDSKRDRTGAPLTTARHDRGLSSEIGYWTDGNGNALSNAKRKQLNRLRREHGRAKWRSKAERNLGHACTEIARMCGALDLLRSIREVACQLYRQAQAAELIRGRSIETMASGCVYAACRIERQNRSVAEIASVAQVPKSKVELGYNVLNREFELPAQVVTPSDRLPALLSAIGVPESVRRRVCELVAVAEETGLANGRNPRSVAAACLYLAGEEFEMGYTQMELADLAGVSTVTLRARYQELLTATGRE